MKSTDLYKELAELAKNLGIKIRKETGSFTSGLCMVNDKTYILINKSANLEMSISIIAKSLGEVDTRNLYIKPVIREFIEKEMLSDMKNSKPTHN